MITIKTKLIHPNAKLPTRAHNTDAGFDLYCTHSHYNEFGFLICHNKTPHYEFNKQQPKKLNARSRFESFKANSTYLSTTDPSSLSMAEIAKNERKRKE